MSLYPGGRESVGGSFQYSVTNKAMEKSVVDLIEKEMEALHKAIKGTSIPLTGQDDRRILFAAIARGIIGYLNQNQAGNVEAQTSPAKVPVKFKIDMDQA